MTNVQEVTQNVDAEAVEAAKAAKKAAAEAAKAAKDAAKQIEKAAKEAAKAQAKAEKEALKETAKLLKAKAVLAKAPKEQLATQNGETRPKESTIGGRIWSEIDKLAMSLQRPPSIREVKELESLSKDLVVNVTSIYARWKKFNGAVGKIEAPVQAPAEAVAA